MANKSPVYNIIAVPIEKIIPNTYKDVYKRQCIPRMRTSFNIGKDFFPALWALNGARGICTVHFLPRP